MREPVEIAGYLVRCDGERTMDTPYPWRARKVGQDHDAAWDRTLPELLGCLDYTPSVAEYARLLALSPEVARV